MAKQKKVNKSSVKKELEQLLFAGGNIEEEGLLSFVARVQSDDLRSRKLGKVKELFKKL